MNDFITRVLRIRKVVSGRDFYISRQVKISRMTFGNRYADWTFCPDGLGEDSVVFSFGVGEDISFDLQMIDHFRVQVHAFDPSQGSKKWLDSQNVPEEFHFYPYGLAHKDGHISFTQPTEPGIRSLRMTDPEKKSELKETTFSLPVQRLSTILRKLGHHCIDILKMDIEGAEFGVIEDIISSPVPISQVLIEFHHRFSNFSVHHTRKAIARLNDAGYSIFNVSGSGEEISFIKSS